VQHAAVVYSYPYRDFLYCGAFLLLPIGYCFYLLEIGYWGWRMKMDGRFFVLVLTSLLASADLRILWSFCFCDNPLRDSMHFVFLRKSFHTCCKGMRSFYLSSLLLLLYSSLTITMIYLMLYSY
jgi:hypothetical protein